MEYFRKNPEKESLTGGCLGEERMMKFYRCKKCGKAVAVLGESGEDMFCRNAEIEELIPNTTDAAGFCIRLWLKGNLDGSLSFYFCFL